MGDRFDDIAADATRAGRVEGEARNAAKATDGRLNGGGAMPVPDLSILDATRHPPPPLPLEVFGEAWARWIEEEAEARGAPPDYVAAGLLAAAGVALGNARWSHAGGSWKEPPVLWIAAVGRPSANKSPGLDPALEVLAALEAERAGGFDLLKRRHEADKAAARERRAMWEREVKEAVKLKLPPPPLPEDAAEPEPPARPRLFTSDATVEKFARLAAVHPRGLMLFRDELAGWLGQLDKYGGSGDRPFWLQAFGGRPYVVDRVKDGDEPIRVARLTASILGGIQPDKLASTVFAGDDDGLAARFLYVWPELPPLTRPKRAADGSFARTALGRLLALAPAADEHGAPVPVLVPLSDRAADAFHAFRVENRAAEEGAAGLYLGHLGKLPGVAVRLALILEHLWWAAGADAADTDGPREVDERAMLAAVALVADYFAPMARRAMADAGLPPAERDALKLARWLAARRSPPERINARELRRMADGPGIRDAGSIKAALAELVEAGWLTPAETEVNPLGGRRREDYTLNPRLSPALAARRSAS